MKNGFLLSEALLALLILGICVQVLAGLVQALYAGRTFPVDAAISRKDHYAG